MATYGRRPPRRRDEKIRNVAMERTSSAPGITGAGSTELSVPGTVSPSAASVLQEIKGPWLRDQTTLSMEAKLLLLESRASSQLTLADLNYTNSITILELRDGIYVKLEPTGGYCLSWRPN